jgi:HEAT repeat protein
VSQNIKLLADSNPNVRKKAVETLGRSMNKAAINPLVELFKSETDLDVRRALILSLSLLGGDKVLPILLNTLENDSDVDTRRNAAGGLRFFGDKIEGKEILELILKEADHSIRNVLVGTLIYMRDTSLIPKLLKLFSSEKDLDLKGCLLEVLGTFDNKKTKELLISCTSADTPEKLRFIATRAIGKLDDVNLIPTLYEVYKNDMNQEIVDFAENLLTDYTIMLGFQSIDQMVLDILDSQEKS